MDETRSYPQGFPPPLSPEPGAGSPPTPQRPLTRIRRNRVLAGVCTGLAARYGWELILVRIAFVFLALIGGGGILLYLLCWIMIPKEKETP